MPHATKTHSAPASQSRSGKGGAPKQLRQIQDLYDETKALYDQSSLAKSVQSTLKGKLASRSRVTKVVSLGLGSFTEKSKDQGRRLKQLVLFIALAEQVKQAQQGQRQQQQQPVHVYAQDPGFTKTDAAFLQTLGVSVLKTPSTSDLGEASAIIDEDTLVYSPFLTIEAYRLLMDSCRVSLLVGDDFNALRAKWEKGTSEHQQVEYLIKSHVARLSRRAVSGAGFWDESDRAFPVALYWKQDAVAAEASAPRARL
ncbi:hypothetical protein BX600DRAFT_514121 [Xylariales sp. PMI_506]|nr:hypothetical protein BX600DRAFT_514121 [Xylariales sp. PMI_506]